jgi:UDP-N-acetylmuramyl pentapeptide phosphotransferase/UDP-N-acetylglucosamine-1-phosphate transferase
MKSFGVIVLVLGIIMTTMTGFNIVTRKKVVDLGSVEINQEEKTPVYWSPVTGGILIVVGAVLVIAGKRKL